MATLVPEAEDDGQEHRQHQEKHVYGEHHVFIFLEWEDRLINKKIIEAVLLLLGRRHEDAHKIPEGHVVVARFDAHLFHETFDVPFVV